ncbi:hypothetical protein BBB02_02220 [Wolbachia endosymbiont of Bemisia tabaci]|uniref:hypothetical protein n=1 Tax=Wolbachia endosymbiont of Bemisia tabaci TaxID=215173 RepID=UPI000FD165C6|nr:hypothetical protein [Wolbachia endosymbiont of Bemisia tabaci]AZU37397.1 hypothetical protein BBB02_02220 [Wolbachia endosymbiont of Bemisia tabaci]
MLTFVLDGVRYTYNWLIKKSRSTTLDFIALFNKKYADSKRIEYILKDIKIDLGLQVPNLEVKKLKEFDFKSNDLLLTKSDINFHNTDLLKDIIIKPDFSKIIRELNARYEDIIIKPNFSKIIRELNQDEYARYEDIIIKPNFSKIIGELNQDEYARYKDIIIKPNFSKIIRKLNQDEYVRYIDNLSFIFPLMLVYTNFVHSDWVSDKYGNSALIELIKTCDSRKIMEEKIDLWKEKGKLTIDISLDAGSLAYINGMFPLIQKAIKNRSFIIQNYSGLYESGIEQLVTEFKDCKSLKETQEVIDDLTQNYVQYMERCIEEKTGIKTITYDPCGVLDPVSSLKNISINVLEKHGLLSK